MKQVEKSLHARLLHAKTQRRKARALSLAVAVLSAGLLLALLLGSVAAQDETPVLHPGPPIAGAIESSNGDNWRVTVCAGDVATVTLTSEDFTPYLEVTDATDAVVASGLADEDAAAVVLTATTTTSYTVLAGPDRRSARGDYTLAMTPAHLTAAQLVALDADGAIAAGEVVTGVVARQAGERWLLYGCAGDVLTVTVTSQVATGATFTPYLELFAADGEELLADAEGDATGVATIAGFTLDVNGPLLVVVTGVTNRDRGAYALAITPAGGETGAGASVPPSATRRATATPTVRATATPVALSCTVQTNDLNLRSGPGVVYDPPLRKLNAGTPLRALARSAAADWIQVEVLPARTPGWVALRFVNCVGNVQSLPVGLTPPTPQPTATPIRPTAAPATPTFTPTPTSTPPALVVIPGGGPSGGGWDAEIKTGDGLALARDGVAIFRSGVYIRLDIYSTPGNRRVQQVRFVITDDDSGSETVHTQTETVASYCSFGGNEACEILRLDRDARWPATGIPLRNHRYTVGMEVTLDDGTRNRWEAPIQVDSPDLVESGGQQPVFAAITETGPGSNSDFVEGALAFRVDAYDPAVGPNGGDGIDFVLMWVYGPDGREVRFRREGQSGYCIFENGEPTCNAWVFADRDNRWPEGEPFQQGPHRLYAEVHASDGRVVVLERVIEIQ